MAEAFIARGLHVTQIEQLPEVLPTVDTELGALVRRNLTEHGVEVLTNTKVTKISRTDNNNHGRLRVEATTADGATVDCDADVVLVSVGVQPDTSLWHLGLDTRLRPGLDTGVPHLSHLALSKPETGARDWRGDVRDRF